MTNFGKLMLALVLLLILAVVFALVQRGSSMKIVETIPTATNTASIVTTTASSTVTKGQTTAIVDNTVPANAENTAPEILGNKSDLVSFSIASGGIVSGKMEATGEVQNGYFFEGNIIVDIVDVSGKILKKGNGTATGDWTVSGPVSFKTELDFTGLPKGPIYIEIDNDNPSGNSVNNKYIRIPVIIK